MPFVKLDTGILRSTLWIDPDETRIFLTALLLAEPRELPETPTLKVGELEDAGFILPAGWYGFVAAAGPGIVHEARLDTERGMAALRRLSEPDRDSRSQDHGGRRLVRVDGGFVVVNFMRYRDHDYNAAKRAKLYRERKRNAVTVRRNALRDPVTSRERHANSSHSVTDTESRVQSTEEPLHSDSPPPQDSDSPLRTHAIGARAENGAEQQDRNQWAVIRAEYPPSVYPGSHWLIGEKLAYQAIDEKIATWDELLQGVRRYARQCIARETGTRFVVSPKTFFAHVGRMWSDAFEIPVAGNTVERVVSELHADLRAQGEEP